MASKRKFVVSREPNGRRSRAGQDREYPPAQVRRLRDAAMSGLRDPEWGTELGRLYLEGVITAAMYAAGKWWRETAARYLSLFGVFPVRTLQFDTAGGTPPDPDSIAGEKQARRDREAMESFFQAHHDLLTSGRLAESTVRLLCEHDEAPCGMAELIALRNGLSALADHQQKQVSRAFRGRA